MAQPSTVPEEDFPLDLHQYVRFRIVVFGSFPTCLMGRIDPML